MFRKEYVYYSIPIAYVGAVILMDQFNNVIPVLLFLGVIISALIGVLNVLIRHKRRSIQKNLIFLQLLSIPFIDLGFGISQAIREEIKGEVVLSVLDDSFASSSALTVRMKNNDLIGEYDYSIAGIGDNWDAEIVVLGDSMLIYHVPGIAKADTLVMTSDDQYLLKSTTSNDQYRVLVNKLLPQRQYHQAISRTL